MLAKSKDTWLLVAGVVAFLALVVYLGVAFANTHPTSAATASPVNHVAPFVPSNSKLTAVPRGKRGGFAVWVTPAGVGYYGALVPTLVAQPSPGRRFVVGLWLRGARPGRIGVEIDEFAPGAKSVYLVNTTVPAAARWRHFTFTTKRVRGSWLGLGMFIYRRTGKVSARKWFAVRDLSATAGPR